MYALWVTSFQRWKTCWRRIERLWLKLAGGFLLGLYPLLVYLGLKFFDPRWVSLGMIAIVGLRLLSRQLPAKTTLALAGALCLATGLTLVTGSDFGLLLYPVLVNAVLFTLFLSSWLYPPSIIETIARTQEPGLTPEGVAYTRKLTLVWVIFFAINGGIAALTISLGHAYWTLYNGFIAYLLMGTLFLGELAVRKRPKVRSHA